MAFAKLKNKDRVREDGEAQQRDKRRRKWMPGEVLRRKIAGKQNNSRKQKQSVGESELSKDRKGWRV